METKEASNDLRFKVILVGDISVGKSAISVRFSSNAFLNNYAATIDVEFYQRKIAIDGLTDITLQLWDTAGQESFRSIVASFYRKAAAVFVVYDITNRKSFENVKDWVTMARENCLLETVFVLVGNMADLEEKRKVTQKEGRDAMHELQLNLFFETSAKDGSNIDQSFSECAKLVFLNYVSKTKVEASNDTVTLMDSNDTNGTAPFKTCRC